MNKLLAGIFVLVLLVILISSSHHSIKEELIIQDLISNGWPAPVYDYSKNPPTREGIALGRKLFYEPKFSSDSSVACASCHLSYTAFTHIDHKLSHGVHDRFGARNSLALVNLAWNKSFMWDGAIHHLDMQALAPIEASTEMDSDLQSIVDKLQRVTPYPKLFHKAFGDSILTGEHLLKALSQFQLTLISANSKYDKIKREIAGVEFTPAESRGYELFKSNCASCHHEPLFTSGDFANNGLPMDKALMDLGRMRVTGNPADSLYFKIPTLRNIEFSFPYMHDGRFRTLDQVLNHYSQNIDNNSTVSPELKDGITLDKTDEADLVSFLLALTDKAFLTNPDHAFPR